MSEINIETITAVHVGSGNFLQYNTDYVYDKETKHLFIIDDRKVLELIEKSNLENWVLSIERGENTKDFVQRCNPQAKTADFSKRKLELFDPVKPNDTLKECIHDGMGRAYIPGSSIKGAIRSAVLATYIGHINHLEDKIQGKKRVSAQQIEEEFFGKMQNDIFRFLQVGDAIFPPECEIAERLTMGLNITQQPELTPYSNRKPQLVEVIRPQEKATFKMKLDERILENEKTPECMTNLSTLFSAINAHTQQLIEREIEFWKKINEKHTGAEDYLDFLDNILEDINACKDKQCLLRLGHGSGWDFITGGWARKLQNFEDTVIPAARPKNYNYEEYPFPKSRRLDTDHDMLGFVKLSF